MENLHGSQVVGWFSAFSRLWGIMHFDLETTFHATHLSGKLSEPRVGCCDSSVAVSMDEWLYRLCGLFCSAVIAK